MHRPPLLTGKRAFDSTAIAGALGVITMPHCSAQYGQCVAVLVVEGNIRSCHEIAKRVPAHKVTRGRC